MGRTCLDPPLQSLIHNTQRIVSCLAKTVESRKHNYSVRDFDKLYVIVGISCVEYISELVNPLSNDRGMRESVPREECLKERSDGDVESGELVRCVVTGAQVLTVYHLAVRCC